MFNIKDIIMISVLPYIYPLKKYSLIRFEVVKLNTTIIFLIILSGIIPLKIRDIYYILFSLEWNQERTTLYLYI